MAIMTEDDYYEIKVYPKGNRVVLRFVGEFWNDYDQRMIYWLNVRPLIQSYSKDSLTWETRITLTHGYYVWTWQPKVLDIKGDG